MRILHIDEQRGWRGGEQQASYLIRGLVERGHDCAIAGRTGSAFVTADHGPGLFEIVEAPFRGEADLWTAFKLSRAVRRLDIDILHAHTSHALTYAVLARKLAGRGKVVASRRVDFPPRQNAFSRWKYGAADHIIAISGKIAEVMRTFGVPESRLSVVYSGIDPARLDVPPLSRSSLGVPEGVPLLGNVAALVGHKDHQTLIAAMAEVLRAVPEAHLVVAGEGPLRPELERQIAGLNLGHAVHLLGFRNDVPAILKALDVFVMSSKEEGLGTSVLDAMAAGVPVVATAAGGIPEMVRDRSTGLLATARNPRQLADQVIEMVRDCRLAERLRENALTLVYDRFTTSAMVAGNSEVYENVVRSG
ncbi:MAG: hypothetical protein AMXMBFR82_12300 [Candidatus Hydrogenedentota bacterium]